MSNKYLTTYFICEKCQKKHEFSDDKNTPGVRLIRCQHFILKFIRNTDENYLSYFLSLKCRGCSTKQDIKKLNVTLNYNKNEKDLKYNKFSCCQNAIIIGAFYSEVELETINKMINLSDYNDFRHDNFNYDRDEQKRNSMDSNNLNNLNVDQSHNQMNNNNMFQFKESMLNKNQINNNRYLADEINNNGYYNMEQKELNNFKGSLANKALFDKFNNITMNDYIMLMNINNIPMNNNNIQVKNRMEMNNNFMQINKNMNNNMINNNINNNNMNNNMMNNININNNMMINNMNNNNMNNIMMNNNNMNNNIMNNNMMNNNNMNNNIMNNDINNNIMNNNMNNNIMNNDINNNIMNNNMMNNNMMNNNIMSNNMNNNMMNNNMNDNLIMNNNFANNKMRNSQNEFNNNYKGKIINFKLLVFSQKYYPMQERNDKLFGEVLKEFLDNHPEIQKSIHKDQKYACGGKVVSINKSLFENGIKDNSIVIIPFIKTQIFN